MFPAADWISTGEITWQKEALLNSFSFGVTWLLEGRVFLLDIIKAFLGYILTARWSYLAASFVFGLFGIYPEYQSLQSF